MAATAKAAANSNIEARLATLRDDLETLQKDIKGLAGEVGGVASNRANEALKSAEKLAARAYDLAEETANQATAYGAQAAEDIETWTNENAESLRETVREQPLMSLAIAVGAGAFLALLLRR
jgi:ElaB/YqjD/DUF883 family membrane-anchored ribosome-binding protein